MKVTRAASLDDYAFDDSDEEEVQKIDQNFVDSGSDEESDEPVQQENSKKPRKVNKKE